MEPVAIRQSNFSAGELSPKALGRTDSPSYGRGTAQMRDWVINPQGSISRRPGFKHVGACKDVSQVVLTERVSPAGNYNLEGVVFAPELDRWVAVGQSNGVNPVIVYSDDDGVTWVEAPTIPAIAVTLNSVAWSGSRFVAVGDVVATESTVLYSGDGTTWIDASPTPSTAKALNKIVWTGSLFLTVGVNLILSSPDGASWSERSTTYGGLSIAHSSTSGIAITASIITGSAWGKSLDGGVTWVAMTRPPAFNSFGAFDAGSQFFLVGYDTPTGFGAIYRGNGDGSWTGVETGGSEFYYDGGLFGDLIVVVGEVGVVALSPDNGDSWTESFTGAGVTLNAVDVRTPGEAVMVGNVRGGDAEIYTAPVSSTLRRLIPFDGSTGAPYMLELGHLYMRFWRNEIAVESSPGVPLEIVTPWPGGVVRDLQYSQANDVMYLAHKDHAPRKITRTSELAFTLADMLDVSGITDNPSTYLFRDGPYQSENPTVVTITPSGVSGSITLQASFDIFADSDVGRTVRMFYVTNDDAGTGEWGWMVITVVTDANTVTARVIDDAAGGRNLAATTATKRWALGAFSSTTGYPSAVTFASQRLIFGGTDAEPQNHWGSVIASFEEFKPTSFDDIVTEDNGIVFTIATRKLSRVQWLVAVRSLVSGMKTGPFTVQGSDEQASISPVPGGISSRLASEFDASAVQPAVVGNIVVYAQTGGRVIRGIDVSQEALNQPNLTLLSDHVTQTGVVEMVYAPVPMSVLWAIRTDGKLIGLTIHPEADSVGWHLHTMGGTLSGSTEPAVISIASLPRSGFDQLYAIVRRTINGATVEHIEAMQNPFDDTETGVDIEDAWHLDAALKYDGAATTTITGLDHLEGETVQIYADGVMQAEKTVSGGAITITAASVVIVGYDVSGTAIVQTVPVRFPDAAMARSTIHEVTLEVLETAGLRIGPNSGNLKNVRLSAGLNSGDIPQQSIEAGSAATDTRPQYVIAAKDALPATVLSLTHIPSVEPNPAG